MSRASLIRNAVSIFEKKDSNILAIYDDRLCNYCGTCFLVCPVNAISYEDGNLQVSDDCIHCQKCLDFCSQNQKHRFSKEIFKT